MPQQNLHTYLPPLFSIWRQANKKLRLRVEGISMRPLIRRGDHVEVGMTDFKDLRPGDIIAFREKQSVVIHRLLVKQKKNGCWRACQKGDNAGNWSWVKSEHVLGRVEVIHGASRDIYLNKGVWRWLHPVIGLLAIGVALMRKTGRLALNMPERYLVPSRSK